MAITYNNLYLDLRQRFHKAGMADPTLEARELVCCAAGKSREELSRDGRLYVPAAVEQQVERLAQRHLEGEPVAYLIGEWEFYGLPLDISESVLIPRPDTEVLVEQALAKHLPGSRVVLGELDEGALRICRQNIRRNDLTGRVVSLQMNALEKPPAHLGEFDAIVSNPPYIPDGDIAGLDVSVRDYEPHLALKGGEDGLDFYRAICAQWRTALRADGRLLFEVGIGQADDVLRIMRSCGFGDVEITPDLNGIPRVVSGILCTEV